MDFNQLPSATLAIMSHLNAEWSIINSYRLDRRQRCTDPSIWTVARFVWHTSMPTREGC